MARRSRLTDASASRGADARKPRDAKGLSATELDILDTLALARVEQENPRDGLTREELFTHVAPGIWGHAAVAAAQGAGFDSQDNDELVRLGQRPYFETCLKRLLNEQALIESQGVITLATERVRLGGNAGAATYLPGLAKRVQRRRNLRDQATALLQAEAKYGLHELFPEMLREQFDELVLSMQTEGYDVTKPIICDADTGQIIDGFHREKAARQANVEASYLHLRFKDDRERIRFAIRSNLIRGHLLKQDRDRLAAKLAVRHLSTREIARMLGPLPSNSAVAAQTGASALVRKAQEERRSRGGKKFGKVDRARWGTEDRKRQAERDALEWYEGGNNTWARVGELLCVRYELDQPITQSTAYTMAQSAKAAIAEVAARTDE